jgi:hypothetical protein
VYNYNISQLADSNNDIASKRYTRWSTVYQYGGYNNTFSTEVLKFKIPPAVAMTSGITLGSNITTVLTGALAVGSFRDIKFGNNGASVFVLGREFPAGIFTTFVKYGLSINYDMSTIDTAAGTTYTFSTATLLGLDGFYFSDDGLKLFTIDGGGSPRIKQFALTAAWDLSTLTGVVTTQINLVNPADYISFAENLQNSAATKTMYYGLKGSTTIYKRDVSGYSLATAGAEVAIVPVPNDPIYGVYAADDGDALSAVNGLRTVLTFVNYAAGSRFIRAHTSSIAASNNITIFNVGNYRNLKIYNASSIGAFHASRFGGTCVAMSTAGVVISSALQNNLLHSPVTGIERIIVSGYYTAANPITLTLTGDGLTNTYNLTLPASTDALERRFEFDGKKINIIDSLSASTPTIAITSAGIYNITKLDVELHFVSDRLANHFSKAVIYQSLENQTGIINLDNNDYITENESVLAAKVNTSKRKVATINRENYYRDSSFRWVHYSALNISNAAAHIFELPTTLSSTVSNNTNNSNSDTYYAGQVITGFYIAISTIGGGIMNIADTITINSGANFKQTVNLTATNNQQINFQPTISGVLPAPFFGSAEQINGSTPVPGATWDTRFFTISTTTALLLKVQVYLMYA